MECYIVMLDSNVLKAFTDKEAAERYRDLVTSSFNKINENAGYNLANYKIFVDGPYPID